MAARKIAAVETFFSRTPIPHLNSVTLARIMMSLTRAGVTSADWRAGEGQDPDPGVTH